MPLDQAQSDTTVVYPMRLQKFLARAGAASRRGSEDLMTAGRVTVNGEVATQMGTKIDPLTDLVCIDGNPVDLREHHTYIMLNKPTGYLTTMDDPQGRPTVRGLIPIAEHPGLFPVGRLDFDTTGLLLFMTDGELGHRLLHPKYEVPKRYLVAADGVVEEFDAEELRRGIMLRDGMTKPAIIEIIRSEKKQLDAREELRSQTDTTFSKYYTDVLCTITEGRKHQVKRMFARVGHPVLRLKREALAALELGDLPEGSWRKLTQKEISTLKAIS